MEGPINDPDLNAQNDIQKGRKQQGKPMPDILNLGIPTGSELLDPILPQYYADLICWASIGARTSESQTHREMSVAYQCQLDLKMPQMVILMWHSLPFRPHNTHMPLLGFTQMEPACPSGIKRKIQVLILSFAEGSNGPNYSSGTNGRAFGKNQSSYSNKNSTIVHMVTLEKKKPTQSGEQYYQSNQGGKSKDILGVMIESFLTHGNQNIANTPLNYGQSITDECIGWEETEQCSTTSTIDYHEKVFIVVVTRQKLRYQPFLWVYQCL